MRTMCNEELGIQEEELTKYFSYKYFGYIRVTKDNKIDVITRDSDMYKKGKTIEKMLRERGVRLTLVDLVNWYPKYDLPLPGKDLQTYFVTVGHKDFRSLLWKKLLDGSLGVKLFLTEFCGETPDLKPIIKKEVFTWKDAPFSPKVYFDENGTEMPGVFVHGLSKFPEKK